MPNFSIIVIIFKRFTFYKVEHITESRILKRVIHRNILNVAKNVTNQKDSVMNDTYKKMKIKNLYIKFTIPFQISHKDQLAQFLKTHPMIVTLPMLPMLLQQPLHLNSIIQMMVE